MEQYLNHYRKKNFWPHFYKTAAPDASRFTSTYFSDWLIKLSEQIKLIEQYQQKRWSGQTLTACKLCGNIHSHFINLIDLLAPQLFQFSIKNLYSICSNCENLFIFHLQKADDDTDSLTWWA